jgi:hypothetical protein
MVELPDSPNPRLLKIRKKKFFLTIENSPKRNCKKKIVTDYANRSAESAPSLLKEKENFRLAIKRFRKESGRKN